MDGHRWKFPGRGSNQARISPARYRPGLAFPRFPGCGHPSKSIPFHQARCRAGRGHPAPKQRCAVFPRARPPTRCADLRRGPGEPYFLTRRMPGEAGYTDPIATAGRSSRRQREAARALHRRAGPDARQKRGLRKPAKGADCSPSQTYWIDDVPGRILDLILPLRCPGYPVRWA